MCLFQTFENLNESVLSLLSVLRTRMQLCCEKGLSCVYIPFCISVEWADSKQSCVYISCCSSVACADSKSSLDKRAGVINGMFIAE